MQPERLEEAANRVVSRETWGKIEQFAELLLNENRKQNLISRSTEADLFERHIIDGAQLLRFAEPGFRRWVDIGTGPGLPGIVLALLGEGDFTLVEPRPLRLDFLRRVVSELRLEDRVELVQGRAAAVKSKFDVITGRAVANLHRFLSMSHHLSTENSLWLLPKGKNAQSELEQAKRFWHGRFKLAPSLTDERAAIVICSAVKPRGGS